MNLDKFINQFKYIEEDYTGRDAFNESPKKNIKMKKKNNTLTEKDLEKYDPVKFKEEVNKMVESILDEPRDKMNENIWEYEGEEELPKLRVDTKQFIMGGINELLGEYEPEVVFLVGSTTGYRYDDESDIDVSVRLDISDDELKKLKGKLGEINGRFLTGTRHPVNYYLMNQDVGFHRFDAVYDIMNDEWIKKPQDYGVDLFNVYDEFKKYVSQIDIDKNELKRNMIDVERLINSIKNGGNIMMLVTKIKNKLNSLDKIIDKISSEYDKVHTDRIEAFKRYENGDKQGLSSPNLLPENIKYKLLERYAYLDLMRKLNKLVDETGDIDTEEDLEKVREILRDYGN